MEDITLRYYESEMRYLREAGREFAEAYPDRARMLGLDRPGDRDPFVERLYEAFAFLTGRVRQKLDDDLPEFTEGIVGLLWPQSLRMLPSLSVVELVPAMDRLIVPARVPAGMEFLTNTVTGTDVRCRYRSTRDLQLQPIRLVHAGVGRRDDGRSMLQLRFAIDPAADRAALDLSALRLFVDADPSIAFALHLALTRHVGGISWRPVGGVNAPAMPAPSACVRGAGFSPGDRLLPGGEAATGAFALLLEYFAFREAFLFVDLLGLDVGALDPRTEAIDVELLLTHPFPGGLPFDHRNLRLHCTPVVNLFDIEVEPIAVDHHDVEYRVIPSQRHGGHVEVYSVDGVEAFVPALSQRVGYVPFSGFGHGASGDGAGLAGRFYHAKSRPGAVGLRETWMAIGGHAWERQDGSDELPCETLSVSATGTHGMLPRKALREARIVEADTVVAGLDSVEQRLPPSVPLYPPGLGRFHWRVLSHLAPNYLSLLDATVLRETLALYDWTQAETNRRRIEAIREVSQSAVRRMRHGFLERGVRIEVSIDRMSFDGEGDLQLFGDMLHCFFAQYAELNLFTRLVLYVLPEGRHIEWPESWTGRAAF